MAVVGVGVEAGVAFVAGFVGLVVEERLLLRQWDVQISDGKVEKSHENGLNDIKIAFLTPK